jgi:hypothetical protein
MSMDARTLAGAEDLLSDNVVIEALSQAWLDSKPGTTGGTEEGGFVVEDDNGDRSVIHWPAGSQDELMVPSHTGCRVSGKKIIATFHTHPNTGDAYRQEPGRVDIRAVSGDPDLKESYYAGEFVVSQQWVYLIGQSGEVAQIAATEDILGGNQGLQSCL